MLSFLAIFGEAVMVADSETATTGSAKELSSELGTKELSNLSSGAASKSEMVTPPKNAETP